MRNPWPNQITHDLRNLLPPGGTGYLPSHQRIMALSVNADEWESGQLLHLGKQSPDCETPISFVDVCSYN